MRGIEPEVQAERFVLGLRFQKLHTAITNEIGLMAQTAVRLLFEIRIPADRLDEDLFGSLLYTAGQPDPDLLIRTSGEMRVSNFLLWQISYAELVVTPTLWPDFRRPQLFEALEEYTRRHRRFGGV